MKKIFFCSLLFFSPFFFSCEKEEGDNNDVCEICDSYCCGQLGTEDCCCSEM